MVSKHYSEDLPQGGLEIPCTLTFESEAEDLVKAETLEKYGISAFRSQQGSRQGYRG